MSTRRGLQKAAVDQHLLSLPYYHGFLPREELPYLLKKRGDFLVRMSEVENKKTGKEDERNVIVSVCTGEEKKNKATGQFFDASNMVTRNLVMYQGERGQWWLYSDQKMNSLKDCIDHYRTNSLQAQKGDQDKDLKLSGPVPRATWELHYDNIKLEKQLGHGEFGEVRAGKLKFRGKEVEVAIKMTKGVSDLSKAKRVQMMNEARLMRYLGHPNVIRMYGIGVLRQPLLIVLELASSGGLDSYMRKNDGRTPVELKAQFALDAAAGIEFLHLKHILHRDLASRNCLVHKEPGQRPVAKISDFGLSRHGDLYALKVTSKMPIKWLAPEVLKTLTFSHKTDIWSYGIVVYEIFSDGKEPWPGMKNGEVRKQLLDGKTFDFDCAPPNLRLFIREHLWHQNPDKRPSMAEVTGWMEKFAQTKKFEPRAEDALHQGEEIEPGSKSAYAPPPEPEARTPRTATSKGPPSGRTSSACSSASISNTSAYVQMPHVHHHKK